MTQDITSELVTLRDYWRYAISRFNAADLSYGHGTTTAGDDAAFLLLDSLDLPIDALDPFLDARLLPAERKLLAERIEARVTTRKPSSYLTGRAYIQGVRFHVDERVIVPRSHIGEILFSEYLGENGSAFLPDPMTVESAVDICTGSGCLAVLAAKFFPHAAVDAVDLSADALAVAAKNVAAHEVENQVSLHEGDLFAPSPAGHTTSSSPIRPMSITTRSSPIRRSSAPSRPWRMTAAKTASISCAASSKRRPTTSIRRAA